MKKKTFQSLWGDEIVIEENKDKEILEKLTKDNELDLSKVLKNKKLSIQTKLQYILEEVHKVLYKFVDNTNIIYKYEELCEYIDLANKNGIVAIDTETNNSVDPLTCKLMGLCIYVKGKKPAYVPVNHVDVDTKQRLDFQLTENDIRKALLQLNPSVKVIYHNAKFDYQVLKMTCKVKLPISWDTMVAAYVFNETGDHSLKGLYTTLIDRSQKEYNIEKLFGTIPYEFIPPEIFGIYSAADPYETYLLYEYQVEQFSHKENERLYKLFSEVEMPLVEVTAEMELNGVEFDNEYAKRLSIKYKPIRDNLEAQVYDELKAYDTMIDEWRHTKEANHRTLQENGKYSKSKNEQLSNPINIKSPTQLAILLFDILKLENGNPNPDKVRSTGEEELEYIVKNYPDVKFCKALLSFREFDKLLTTYIEKLPKNVNVDGRIHCSFNQCGTDTGRYSSSDPNLQNIPSGNRELRLLFRADTTKGEPYVIVGGDFSSQEPRLTAFYSQEPKMYQAFKEGKDLYSVIAQNIYNNKYEDNLEFYPKGTKITVNGEEVVCGYKTHQNKAGKERRKHGKTLLLALTYGMGAKSVGESINKTEKEGQELMDNFFKAFPKVKQWIDYNDKFVKEYEYVEDFYGRRRHLKDINAPLYTARYADKDKEALSSFNPYLICENKMSDELVSWVEKAQTTRGKKAFNELKAKALEKGILLFNNSTKISNAKRQTTNSRVQGGAATITKIAMNNIYRDKELNDLGFKLLITVHDEVLGECPKRNAEAVQKRLAQVMVDSAKPYLDVPMACDCYVVPCWYYDELTTQVQEEVEKLVNGDKDKGIAPIPRDEAIKKIREKHIELLDEQFNEMLGL